MKVVLVGPPAVRARLRTQMNGSATIVGEFGSIGSAQAAKLDADAFVMAARNDNFKHAIQGSKPIAGRGNATFQLIGGLGMSLDRLLDGNPTCLENLRNHERL